MSFMDSAIPAIPDNMTMIMMTMAVMASPISSSWFFMTSSDTCLSSKNPK